MNIITWKHFLSGAVMIASLVVAMFFWRFRSQTRDRFFGFFAVAFLLMAVERIAIEFVPEENPQSLVYVIRLAAFLLIVYAILDKNRHERKS
ncbi:MAG TPA: DUF5985 family protein [Verrucomicrobiae bacterium]|jgi:hypothetical protein|nr:DUF5985 family protein [Verrucomicrobiae bacterium]